MVIYRIPVALDKQKTPGIVAQIHATRLTLADVEGKSLPPVPDQAENDATVVGIDKNNNGIRDDVELAIFKKYPTDKKTRAAALQYALELQMEFTQVINSPTLVAVIQEEGRGGICVLDNKKTNEIKDLTFNTQIRKDTREDLFRKYMTSYSLPNENFCDIVF